MPKSVLLQLLRRSDEVINTKMCKISNMVSKIFKQPKRVIMSLFMLMILKDKYARHIASWAYGNIPRLPITEIFPGIESIDIKVLRVFDRNMRESLHIHEVAVLSAIVKFVKANNILEIGTYGGNTALNLAANTPIDAVITTVDLGPGWNGQFYLKVPRSQVNVTNTTKVGFQFKNTKHSKKIKQIFGDSAEIDWCQLSVPFDLVFLDGCHYYAYVKKDTQNAVRYLKSGGILIWHDYGMIKHVTKVVEETAKKMKVKAIQGTRFAVAFVE